MSTAYEYTCCIDVRVDDLRLLYDTAFDHARTLGHDTLQTAQLLGMPDKPDPEACLRLLLDPGAVGGCTVLRSYVGRHDQRQ